MRISDWSSDVCSSDLLQHRADLRAAAMNDDGVDADRLQQHHILGEIAGKFGIAHGMAAIFHHERPPRIALQIRRSEEHTSELQSLMRISYAVFCLKKKKVNTLITNSQQTLRYKINKLNIY